MEKQGAQFLHSKQPSLHVGAAVEHEQARRERSAGETSQKPSEKIAAWLEILERTHGHSDSRVNDRIKSSYHKEYVIKPENVPESTFQLEQRIARNLGHGDIPITDEFRAAKTREIIENQEASLDKWIDYLTSDDATYPTWAKYWAFTSIVKMGKIEKKTVELEDGTERETARFGTRTRDTTAPFPPLNPRALAMAVGVMERHLAWKALPKDARKTNPLANESKRLSDEEFRRLLTTESFDDLYTQFLIELPEYSTEGLRETRGEWRKYDQGSDPAPLVDSLDGHPLEWCTANFSTALTHLQGGDFFVYYSIDQEGSPTVPRVAIRMAGDSIAEVRGIAPDQQLDPYIADVVSEKMAEFPDGEGYQKKAADMARLTEIEDTIQQGAEISREDLQFLYEIQHPIEGFGYHRDPRIDLLRQGRDVRSDLVKALDCRPEQISLTAAEATHGTSENPILFHYGDLLLTSLSSAPGLRLPDVVGGKLDLSSLEAPNGLTLPKEVRGTLDLSSLESADGLDLPYYVGGNLNLGGIILPFGLRLPAAVGGSIGLQSLESAKGIVFPASSGGIELQSLKSAKGLVLPSEVHGTLDLTGLLDGEGLILPTFIGEYLFLDSLQKADGLRLPESVKDIIQLPALKSAEGLSIPRNIKCALLDLSGLTNADGLVLPPEELDASLDLSGLTDAKGLTLPRIIRGELNMSQLKSADGLILPEVINEGLYLENLASAKGLNLPRIIKGDLDLNGLLDATDFVFPEGLECSGIYLPSLVRASGLVFPHRVSGQLIMDRLSSAQGVVMPRVVGSLDLSGLESTEGLMLPSQIDSSLILCRYEGGGAGGYVRVSGLTGEQIREVLSQRPDLREKLRGAPPWILGEPAD